MRRAFLSYRRDDTKYITGFIYQHLEDPAAFGPGSVFMDIDDIPDGVDFRHVIDDAVRQCEFFLTVIGRSWVTPRLMNPNDFVRLEIEAALARNIPVTPVLVDGATMPGEDQLPPTLHPLLYRNARTIRHGKDFKADVLQMVDGLHRGKKWIADRAAAAVVAPATGERRDVSPPVLGDAVKLVPAAPVPGQLREIFLDKAKTVPMSFAWCPPGTFLMGSPATEKDRQDNEQQHSVTLTKGFYTGIHPVTQAQWRAVMGTDPSHFKGDTLPVEQVSWDDAQAFCAKVKEMMGHALRLPTEAEWEYAARGGTTTPFYFGGVLNGTQANCNGNYPYGTDTKGPYLQKTTPVGSYAAKFPHPWGLCDVHGNVYEWCADWYDAAFYGKPEAMRDNPECAGGGGGTSRVLRGGSWLNSAWCCRAARRINFAPADRRGSVGFRVCAVLD